MNPVIVFDGDCLFCQRSVRFIHRHDGDSTFRFATRQSTAGQKLLHDLGFRLPPNSLVLVDAEGTWLRSDAVLRIAGQLDAPWSAAGVLLVIPRPLRDLAYRLVAAIRYRLTPWLPACELPDAALRAKILS